MSKKVGDRDANGMFTVEESCAMLRIGKSHAYQMLADGSFPVPAIKLGRLYRIPRKPLEAYVNDGAVDTESTLDSEED